MKAEIIDTEALPFPAVDFKFRNTGTGSAVIYGLGIEVLKVDVDVTPLLVFKRQPTSDGTLRITATDAGWGDCCDCDLVISEEKTLNKIFDEAKRKVSCRVFADKENEVFALRMEAVERERLNRILEAHEESNRAEAAEAQSTAGPLKPRRMASPRPNRFLAGLSNFLPPPPRKILLEPYLIHGRCKDQLGRFHAFSHRAQYPDDSVLLDNSGFSSGGHAVAGPQSAPLPSDAVTVAIIDPAVSDTPYEKNYPLSREIAAGKAERFHVVIGATKSCRILARFKFYADGKKVIRSNRFELSIWRPRFAKVHDALEDGNMFQLFGEQWIPAGKGTWSPPHHRHRTFREALCRTVRSRWWRVDESERFNQR
jgi:hypothetical protein